MTPQDQFDAIRKDLLDLRHSLTERLAGVHDRRRAANVRLLHDVRSMLEPLNAYASQAGQDRVIDRVFKAKRGGTFVDVGGYDGVTGSNTLFFEQQRGWTGLLIEPFAQLCQKAQSRRSCHCLPLAIGASEGEAEFLAVTQGYTQMSGLVESYDPQLLQQVRKDHRHKETVLTVPVRTLSSVLIEHNLRDVDFVSLDIEGSELSVLRTFPFDQHRIGAWSIENNTAAAELGEIMEQNGYCRIEFCGPDEIFVHKDNL